LPSDVTDAEWVLIEPLLPVCGKLYGASAVSISSPTAAAIWFTRSFTAPTSRTVTARRTCLPEPMLAGPMLAGIVKRSDAVKGFEGLPRRWVAERTLAWSAAPPCQGLRVHRRKRHGVAFHGFHSAHDPQNCADLTKMRIYESYS